MFSVPLITLKHAVINDSDFMKFRVILGILKFNLILEILQITTRGF